MKKTSLSACLLAFALGAFAGEIAKDKTISAGAEKKAEGKPKTRTLKELTEQVLAEGRDDSEDAETAKCLGFGRAETPEKLLRYKRKISPDGKEHTFAVAIKEPAGGKKVPVALIWATGTVERSGDEVRVDAITLRLSLDGKLKQACRSRGKPGEIVPEHLSTKSAEVKKQYEYEKDFHLRKAPTLGLEFSN